MLILEIWRSNVWILNSLNPKTSDEKVKPFTLVKYFTFASLIVIFLGTIVLSLLNTHLARTMQLAKSEDYALLLAENLNHQIIIRFVLPVVLKFGRIQLRNKEQFEQMDEVIRSTLHSFKVDMVNIYDKYDNIISYSFDQTMIGRMNAGGTGYQNAVTGKSTSKLVQRGSFWEMLLGFPKESTLITFAPLRAEKPLSRIAGPVLGVIEIVQDLSEDYKTIFSFQITIIITCFVIMGILFLVLLVVVKRGESISQRRTQERLRLKEQLNRAEHLSALGEMIAGISHEIRNPLGIIRSSAELLKKKMSQVDPSNSFPDIIVEESERLNNLITDFLNFAKPKAPNLLPCRVDEVLEKNITFLGSQIREQHYKIKKDYGNNLPEIMADSEMLYQAFLNILINAMQAMPEGGIIHVEIEPRDNTNSITICIKDEGKGIPKDIMEKIWDPFFTTKDKGTGLGLGIVKSIIESHDGSIRIDNRHGSGTTVVIELFIEQEV